MPADRNCPEQTRLLGRVVASCPGGLCVNAPAKINLNLLVWPLRSDGYHPLDSYVSKITLYDRLELRLRDGEEIRLICEGQDCGPDDDNLAVRAARLMQASATKRFGLDIRLTKRIPPGKGLGGGSSDAAAVMVGVRQLLQMEVSDAELFEAAASLGSDVPLFLAEGAVRMTGRGEILEPVQVHAFFALLYLPDLFCGTGDVYRAFDAAPPQPERQLPADLLGISPPSTWRHRLVNHLESAARSVNPELGRRFDDLQRVLPDLRMTGSGSALFSLHDSIESARAALNRVPGDLRDGFLLVRSAEQ
ncbi:MAG: 4-(cytidine 5'-diphospho)-2-C-methyl-D-erythritol kinase [Phycisphaerae bacterium]